MVTSLLNSRNQTTNTLARTAIYTRRIVTARSRRRTTVCVMMPEPPVELISRATRRSRPTSTNLGQETVWRGMQAGDGQGQDDTPSLLSWYQVARLTLSNLWPPPAILNMALPSTRRYLVAFDMPRHAVVPSACSAAHTTTRRTAWSILYCAID